MNSRLRGLVQSRWRPRRHLPSLGIVSVSVLLLAAGLAGAGRDASGRGGPPVREGLLPAPALPGPGERIVRRGRPAPVRWAPRWLARPTTAGVLGLATGDSVVELRFGASRKEERFFELGQSAVALPSGGYAVVWTQGDSSGRRARLQWLSAGGVPRLGPRGKLVAGRTGGNQHDVVAAASPAGGIFVAFDDDLRIYAQRFDRAGRRQWPRRGVEVARRRIGEAHTSPYLVPDAAGGVFVCFTQLGTVQGILCQHLDRAGNRLWGDGGLEAGGAPGWRVLPRGVADGSGGLLIFWRNQRETSDVSSETMLMEGQHFAADGTRLWSDRGRVVRTTNLPASNGHVFTFYGVVPDGAGGAVLAFNDWLDRSRPNLDVAAQRVAGDGTLVWGEGVRVAARSRHHQHEATVAAGDGGAFVVAYEHWSLARSKLRVYRLGPNGRHVWPARGVELSRRSNRALNFAARGAFDGELLWLAWTEQQVPNTLAMDVKLARYAGNGTRRDPPEGAALSTAVDAQFLRGLVLSGAGDAALAVWEDRRKGTWDDLDAYGAFLTRSP